MGFRKIDKHKEDELVRLYRQDTAAAEARCRELGLHPTYAATASGMRGDFKKPTGRGARPKPSKSTVSKVTFDDPRWERAKRIGAIVI